MIAIALKVVKLVIKQYDKLFCISYISFFIVSVHFYLTIFKIIQFCGIIFSFAPGFILDWAPSGRHRNFSIIISFILTGVGSILLTIGFLIPVFELQVINDCILRAMTADDRAKSLGEG